MSDPKYSQSWSSTRLAPGFGAVAATRGIGAAPRGGGGLSAEALAAHIRAADARIAVARGRRVVAAEAAGRALQLEPLSPCIGTVVHGVDLADPLPAGLVAFLRALWLERKVLFFRGQGHLTQAQHAAFSAQFGELGGAYGERKADAAHVPKREGVALRDVPDIGVLHSSKKFPAAADNWHSDATWSVKPPLGSVLMCRKCPPIGGDTLWCDAYAMWEGLPLALRKRLAGLSCLHEGHIQHAMDGKVPTSVHPACRTHPETGATALFISPHFTRSVVGVAESESERILAQCFASAGRPEYTCRFQWEEGSLAMWDNRSCLHYAVGDYWPHTRRMERFCIIDPDESRRVPYFAPRDGSTAAAAAKL